MYRLALIFALATWSGSALAAEPGQTPPPSPAPSSSAPASSDRITAAIIVKELKALGYAPTVDIDDSGDPRVNMAIDGFDWSIYFYDCAPGARDDRQCNSYQFYSGYTLKQAISPEVINRWNTDRRYAKAYTYLQRNGSHSARIEIDVRSAGTGADPARTFRVYFNIMKDRADEFRKAVGYR
ncbi:MAG: YbjN domain-containing protein [Xanthobacteraceae bacterium]|nr:YbjN domain-containing protein [Xanthobacteraceae bacterium]